MKRLTAEQLDMYEQFTREFHFCFCCGINPKSHLSHNFPARWLERAHILRGPSRTADRRNIVMLCKLCHDLENGDTIKDENKQPLPNLTKSNMLWLKKSRDHKYFDLDYLNSISIGKMPEPECPPTWFINEWTRTQDSRIWGEQ